jgi:hypothetical protein
MKLMFHLENMEMHWYIIYPILITRNSYINHICICYKPFIKKIETTYDIIPNI